MIICHPKEVFFLKQSNIKLEFFSCEKRCIQNTVTFQKLSSAITRRLSSPCFVNVRFNIGVVLQVQFAFCVHFRVSLFVKRVGGQCMQLAIRFNPLQSRVAYLYPLKTSENLEGFRMFSGGKDKQNWFVMGLVRCVTMFKARRGVFKNLSHTYDLVFLQKQCTTSPKTLQYRCLRKGSRYASGQDSVHQPGR